MDLQKINVKFPVEKGADLPLSSFIPVFHRFIQEDRLEGMLIDVAEYTHVHQGPGVLLIAHEANYSLDETDGKRGLLYAQKRVGAKESEGHLKTAFRRALSACALLEKESAGKLKFAANRLQVQVNDRLEAPHNSEAHGELESLLNPFLNWLYDGEKYMLLPEKDPRRLTGFEVRVEKPFELGSLLRKLE